MYAFNYVNYPSGYSCSKVGKRIHLLPNHKILSLGYPRCDQYFDAIMSRRDTKRDVARSICSAVNSESKILLYTPTWRPYTYQFPLNVMRGGDYKSLNDWLVGHNAFLFFRRTQLFRQAVFHAAILMVHVGSNMPFMTRMRLAEVDVLLNDYSTTSTDFALLSRPQLFLCQITIFIASVASQKIIVGFFPALNSLHRSSLTILGRYLSTMMLTATP